MKKEKIFFKTIEGIQTLVPSFLAAVFAAGLASFFGSFLASFKVPEGPEYWTRQPRERSISWSRTTRTRPQAQWQYKKEKEKEDILSRQTSARKIRRTFWLGEFTLLDTGLDSTVELVIESRLRSDIDVVVVLNIFFQSRTTI